LFVFFSEKSVRLRRCKALEALSVLANFCTFLGCKMVANAARCKKKLKLAARTPANMRRANLKKDPKPSEKIRNKKAPQPSERARQKRINMENWRASRTIDDTYRGQAIDTASQRWRKIIKALTKKRKPLGCRGRPTKIAFRPKNYDELLELIPLCHRGKPSAAGEKVIYLPHDSTTCTAWTHAKVVSIHRHKDANWVLVKKPFAVENENPYVAIDSTNVFLAPPQEVNTSALPNEGVYVLYCPTLDSWYVGESHDIAKRIERHKAHKGPKATKTWPSFERRPLLTSKRRNERWTRWEAREWDALRNKYGYRNVRGAGSSQSQ